MTGERADQTELCALLGSFAPVEHPTPSLVPLERLALTLATRIETTALSALQGIFVKVHTPSVIRHVKAAM